MRIATGLAINLGLLAIALAPAGAQDAAQADRSAAADAAWQRIGFAFQPPPEWDGKLGQYRSPLIFDDGRPVKTPEDWARRRQEILQFWHASLGAWPPLLDQPAIETVEAGPRENFTQKKVLVGAAENLKIRGYLLIPQGDGPHPAVLVVYYEPETGIGQGKSALRDFAYQLARRGFVALSIGWPTDYTRQQSPARQPLSSLAYLAANCYHALAALPEVDPARVGIVGHSFGGKWALFASCLYDKFACGAWSDPGIVFDEKRPNVNYWEPWYLGWDPQRERKPGVPTEANPRTGPYRRLFEAGRDLHELHALMAPRPFLVSGGAEDRPERWKALNHALAVNRLLGCENRVAMTNRPAHSPTEESNEQIYVFFEHFLKPAGPASGGAVRGAGPAEKSQASQAIRRQRPG
ncbi:MAG: alpha/beta hydrolase [Candidatus Anammoximicrobium sp.]|nr:alpha/beta hydrolase [Candidatus Anammoximicrobium sp.]